MGRKFETGLSQRAILAAAVLATAAVQQAQAATLTLANQAVYVSEAVDFTDGGGPYGQGILQHDSTYRVVYGTDSDGNSGLPIPANGQMTISLDGYDYVGFDASGSGAPLGGQSMGS